MALRHFVISSIARFFSEGTSRREMLSRTERTRSCGVFGLFDLLKRNAIYLGGDSENCQAAGVGTGQGSGNANPSVQDNRANWHRAGRGESARVCA